MEKDIANLIIYMNIEYFMFPNISSFPVFRFYASVMKVIGGNQLSLLWIPNKD